VSLAAFAPAKVNLFLHVGPPRPDGFHPLCSLMAFADLGDRLRLEPGAPGFAVEGPFAADLEPLAPGDNLVARALAAVTGGRPLPGRLVLEKRLPVASGLGGGSADAGAALRLARRALALDLDDAALEAAALSLGSDGPACLWGRPVVAEGRGEKLSPALGLPLVHAVLANPRVACPTGAVYRAYDAGPRQAADRPALPARFEDVAALAAFLGVCRNDLEPPAAALVPAVAETLARLRARPEALIARLSGSGATCFALCADEAAARGLAATLAAERPDWWIVPCRLGGPWPDAV
jgi:4-diphosphocytidyl-2-C-methyl-D-erythritol kinase